jgi:hypothetical protein
MTFLKLSAHSHATTPLYTEKSMSGTLYSYGDTVSQTLAVLGSISASLEPAEAPGRLAGSFYVPS